MSDGCLTTQLCNALRPALRLEPVDAYEAFTAQLAEHAIQRHRVGALLHKACLVRDGNIVLDEETARMLAASYKRSAVYQMRQSGTKQKLARLFASEGIAFCFFKGFELGQELYDDPAARTVNDVDVLIAPGHEKAAITVMNEGGYTYHPASIAEGKVAATARQYQDMKIQKDLSFMDEQFSIAIELHHRLFRYEPEGYSRDFWQSIPPSGSPCVGNAHYCLYLILHSALSERVRLKWTADLSLLFRAVSADTVHEIVTLAEHYGCDAALFSSAMLTEKAFPGSLNGLWLDVIERNKEDPQAQSLLERGWESLTVADGAILELPFKANFSSGMADLVFPGRIPFLRSAIHRWVASLSIRI